MKRAFGMFALTRAEQRVVIAIVFTLVIIVLAKHYRDVGTIVPARPAWQSLLWLIPVTVLWIVLIYWQPAISASGVPITAVRLMTYGLIGVGLWLGLESTDLTPGQCRATWLAVSTPLRVVVGSAQVPFAVRTTESPPLSATAMPCAPRPAMVPPML